MALFKSKEQKEMERKQAIKRAMNDLEKRIKKLEAQKIVYINAAKDAIKEELPEQIALAKNALKLTEAERKRTKQMLLNTQVISQLRDMTAMTTEFLGTVKVISKSIAQGTSADVNKIGVDLAAAMEKVGMQTDALEDMLEESQSAVVDNNLSGDALVSDDEIEQMIYGTGAVAGAAGDSALDAELEALKNNLK